MYPTNKGSTPTRPRWDPRPHLTLSRAPDPQQSPGLQGALLANMEPVSPRPQSQTGRLKPKLGGHTELPPGRVFWPGQGKQSDFRFQEFFYN